MCIATADLPTPPERHEANARRRAREKPAGDRNTGNTIPCDIVEDATKEHKAQKKEERKDQDGRHQERNRAGEHKEGQKAKKARKKERKKGKERKDRKKQ